MGRRRRIPAVIDRQRHLALSIAPRADSPIGEQTYLPLIAAMKLAARRRSCPLWSRAFDKHPRAVPLTADRGDQNQYKRGIFLSAGQGPKT